MPLSIEEIESTPGLGDFAEKVEVLPREKKGPREKRILLFKGPKVFLVMNATTIEVRTDAKLSALLQKKYESVMESRYFGRGGIEIVQADQLSAEEMQDLIRLSYDLTTDEVA